MKNKKQFNAVIAAALVTSSVAAIAPAAVSANFNDVKTSDYFYNDILDLQQRGIIQGFEDGTFRPNASVTRGQAAKILAGALGLDTNNVKDPGFKDIPKTHQYYGAIAALANAGIISGYEDKTFRQGEKVLRNHMAKMIANGFGLQTVEGTTPFTDVRKDYTQYIAALYDNKVTTGKTATTFAGASDVTRGQLASFVVRAEKAMAVQAEESTFTIDAVTAAGVKTSTDEFTVNESVKAIFTEANAAALKGANVTVLVKGKEIVEVKALTINTASTEEAVATADFGNATISGNVVVKSAFVKLANVAIKGNLIVDELALSPVASLGNIAADTKKSSAITLQNVVATTVEVKRDETNVTSTTKLSNVVVAANVKAVEINAEVASLTLASESAVTVTGKLSVDTLTITKTAKVTLGSDVKIAQLILPTGVKVTDIITNYASIKGNITTIITTEGTQVEAPTTSGGGGGGVYIPSGNGNTTPTNPSTSDTGSVTVEQISGEKIVVAGTYGPATGKQVITGDLFIDTADVNLQNVTVNGNLILGAGIGEGDVHLNGVTVTGQTIVKGGGKNSIYFNDSVLATVIVNKNTGAVRIVAQGSTQVYEVQLETPTLVVEQGLDNGASGFEDIVISEAMQTAGQGFQVELEGVFETINSRATNVRINLSEQTDIRTLILNAAAQVLGAGVIQIARINADGSTLSQRPQNLVLDLNYGYGSVSIAGETVTESYSDPNATATLSAIRASQNAITLELDNYISGLTINDFEVKAFVDGNEITLSGLSYDANKQRITFNPIQLEGNLGKTVQVTVTSKHEKVTGVGVASSYEVATGFAGRITDIQGVGIANLTINFRAGSGTTEGAVVGTATTDAYGYYTVNLPAGMYTGEFTGAGYVTSYMIANANSDVFTTDHNETAIRAAASQEIKIMLSWDEHPRDLDSHLEGPTVDGDQFHIYYGQKRTTSEGIVYADLDWDDVNSYGPETTTIRQLVDGEYRFYVYHFSGINTLRTSGAKVQVFLGNATAPAEIFLVPEGEGTETYWNVFDLVVTNNGADVVVRPVNTLTGEREPEVEYPGDGGNEGPIEPTNPVEPTEPTEPAEPVVPTTNDTAGIITTTADTVNFAFTTTEITQLTTIDSIELISGTSADTALITSADSINVTTAENGQLNVTFNKTRFTGLDVTTVTKVTIRFRNENGEEKALEVTIN